MSVDTLEGLLEKLTAGDAAAAEQVFRTYEPYLRMVVRRRLPARLRSKFDSVDIVQSVWADMLVGFRDAGWRFSSALQLKAFLIKVTHNRFLDRVRKHGKTADREQSLGNTDSAMAAPDDAIRPSQIVEGEELWQIMLRLCPPAHHELLRLKRQGCSLAEIAHRTGLHESSVRRILYDLAHKLKEAEAVCGGPKP